MKRSAACLLLAALCGPAVLADAPPSPPPPGQTASPDGPPRRRGHPDPAALIATELAFGRLARTKGQWTAFLAHADPEAEMFVPERVLAADWLKRRRNPPQALTWDPHALWSSCDGSIAVTQGGWQAPDGKAGVYVTVWRRDPRKGTYRWLIDMGSTMARRPAAPETIPATTAECDGPPLPVSPGLPLQVGDDTRTAVSPDGSLRWTTIVRADRSRRLRITIRRASGADDVIDLVTTPDP